jgi:hypothetical protein
MTEVCDQNGRGGDETSCSIIEVPTNRRKRFNILKAGIESVARAPLHPQASRPWGFVSGSSEVGTLLEKDCK